MASIQKRGKKYCVIYRIYDDEGKAQQKWETYDTEAAAKKRKLEVEYKLSVGTFEVPKCVTVKELLDEYVNLYGREKWSFSTYDGNISTINNYVIPTIGNKKLDQIDNHFIEKYYQELLDMPAVKSSRNMDESGKITAATVGEIHKILRSCFRQAVKWGIMNKNPATDATVPKHKKEEREIWTAEMLMQAIEACENRWLKIAFHLSFTATLRLGELLGLTWDCVEISQKAIDSNSAYIIINKEVERISKKAVEALKQKDIIQVFPSMRKNNRTVRVLKAPKTDSSIRKVYIPSSVAILLAELREGLPDVVFHSLRHTSVTYKLKLSGGDIKAVQGDSGHAQADMVTEVYGHILDEDRKKNAQLIEDAFYKKENLNPDMKRPDTGKKKIEVPDGIDAEALMKVLNNPEMAAMLAGLAKGVTV